jgi:cyclophilin family peptidyl-prolyl cis-trans isomerase
MNLILASLFSLAIVAAPQGAAKTPAKPPAKAPAAPAATAKAPAASTAHSYVALETTKGKIVLELFPEKAPKTVANFLEYAKSGFYNGTIFHRVIDGFMIQGGGFDAKEQKKATRAPVENESAKGLSNDAGTIAMARTGDPHSATAQFFINLGNNTPLNSGQTRDGWGYTAFGKVVEGMDVVNAIAKVAVSPGAISEAVPAQQVVITKASVLSGPPAAKK